MALGTLEGVGNEAVSSNFELLNFAFPRLSSKSVRQIKNRLRYLGRSVCVCVCLLSQISPLERLFVLKILSRTQRATEVKKFVGFSLKPLRSGVMA